mmetsp:Transcript_12296/g.24968  ORF Transcript_12296/g.24968 Transcript_12296/m.24968 type:complete len:235 (-) Transcript_12296:227-931(-)
MRTMVSIFWLRTRNCPGNRGSLSMSNRRPRAPTKLKCASASEAVRSRLTRSLAAPSADSANVSGSGWLPTSLAVRCMSSLTPFVEAAEMASTRVWPAAWRSSAKRRGAWAATSGRSTLLSTTTCVFFATTGLKSSSSLLMALKSPTGSGLDPSTMCKMTRQRATCRKNAEPIPTPSWAPSSKPGMSASTSPSPPPTADEATSPPSPSPPPPCFAVVCHPTRSHTPRFGTTVVKA